MSEDIVGSLVAKVGYDTTGLRKGERETEQSLKKVDDSLDLTSRNSQKLSGHLGQVGTALGALAGYQFAKHLVSGIEDSIQAASDLNETISKTKVVFGDSFDVVDHFAQGSAKSIGLSRQAAEEAAATYGNLFLTMGVGRQNAAEMSTSLVQLAGDLASFNNTSQSDALEALKSGLVGEVEPLRRYGVALTDASLRQEALKLGLVDSTKNALDPAVRTQAAYALILEQTKTAQGDFARTSDGNANSLRKLQADAENAKAELGAGLLPAQLSLIKAADALTPALTTVAKAVGAVGSNEDARHAIELFGGVAAALYLVNKAISATKAVRESELATLYRTTAARRESAAAITAEGTAAAGAAAELRGLGAAEATTRGGPVPTGTPSKPRSTSAVAVGGLAIAAAFANEHVDPKAAADKVLQDPAARRELGLPPLPDKEAAPAPAVPAPLSGQARAANRLTTTQTHLDDAIKARLDPKNVAAESSLTGGLFGGAFDEVSAATTRGDVSAAQDKLTSANDRVRSAQERVAESTRHLNDLRKAGKASTTQLADAEDRLAAARRNLDKATRDQSGRQADVTKAQQPTALSARDLLSRLTGQTEHAQGLATANQKLASSGLAKPVIEQIDALEKTAPGTVARVAASLTPTLVKKLDSEYSKLQKAEHDFLTAPLRAAEAAAKRENERAAQAYAESYAAALRKHMADLDLPLPVGLRPTTSKPVTGKPLDVPVDHEGQAYVKSSTTIHMPNATIVASDPAAMAAELDRQTRINRLAGKE